MAANSSQMSDDLSDITSPVPAQPQSSSGGISPWLMHQAAQELAAGKPGTAMEQFGHQALAQGYPAHQAAYHAENVGILPPGTTQKMLAALPTQKGPSPQPVTAPAAQGPTQASIGTQNVIANEAAMKNAGMKNPAASQEEDTSAKQGTSSSQKVGAEPGTYARGLGEIQGYAYTKNPDGTYTRSANPDPNSPFQKQQSALNQLQALVKQRAAQGIPTRPADLSGLMMGADFLNHTNTFGQDYRGQQANLEQARSDQAKKSEQDFQNEAEALKEQGGLYGQANTGALGIMGGGQLGSVGQIMTAQKAIESAGKQTGSPTTAPNQYFTQVQKIFKPIQDDEAEASKVSQLVNSHNPAAISGIKEALTRLMTGARPQMALIAQQAQDPSIGQRLESYLSQASSGQLPVENVAQMNQMVADLNKVSNARRAVATTQAHTLGDTFGIDRAVQEGLIPAAAMPGLAAQTAHEGKKSIAVQAGKNASQTGPHGASVIQNGHTFNWNPNTRKYE